MVSVEGLTMEFGGFTLFNDISFMINEKDRIALVDRNGAGKSTILEIFAGLQSPTSGTISVSKEVTIGYLPQHMQLVDTRTVREETECAFEHIHEMGGEINRLNTQLTERTDYDSEGYQKLINHITYLSEHFQMMGEDNYHAELERTLAGLGFSRSGFDRPTSEFSGGWRMRIELAKLLLRRSDMLLLDESTNHLGIKPVQWLEDFIAARANAVILVSHNRAFIDNTTFRTLEIELSKVYDYKVKYSEYVIPHRERREQQQCAYENQRKKSADTETFIECFRYKATKSVQVQSRIKQLEKVERIEADDVDVAMLRLKFLPAPRSGSYLVICEKVAKRYDNRLIFDHMTLAINRGDKVTFVGKNGEGKSTLVKCITGEITDFTGRLQLGHNVKIGYFAQNQAQLLNKNLTVFDATDYVAQRGIRLKIRDVPGTLIFGSEASDKKVRAPSGGERTHLAVIRSLLEPVNLLILDEPTNHLDMRSKDVLKNALREFDGTVIVISHDREFLDNLVDKAYEFGNRKIVEHLGGIYDFLEHKKMGSSRELERSVRTSTSMSGTGEAQVSHNKLSYEAKKELSKMVRKAGKAVAEAEARISELEDGIAAIEAKLTTPEDTSDASLCGEYSIPERELSDTTDLRTERTMELEGLNTQGS